VRVGCFVLGETYLPDELVGARFYEPTTQGLEKAIGERLQRLRGSAEREPEHEPSVAKPNQDE
jgi:putative ATPase